ncbi:MAG: succinylglutamate desuccinylase/aspartoacylase family protein [Lautropia sp.]
MHTIDVVQYRSLQPGPRLIVTGAVHGNETCGPTAIREAIARFSDGQWRLARGTLTFVPVANPVAYAAGRREGDRNLNRDFRPCVYPETAEDRIANQLAPLLAEHEVLLDLHSFSAPGEPFVFLGPQDNDGELEPFAHEAAEAALALAAGPSRLVYGWLPAYAKGVVKRASGSVAYGIGTTEYMRHRGGYAVTVECGQHADPAAPSVAARAIDNTLRLLGLRDGDGDGGTTAAAGGEREIELIELCDVIDRADPGDRLAREWRSFDRLAAGEPMAWRHDGSAIPAPGDGYIVFPNPNAMPGREWFYFARPGTRALPSARHRRRSAS